MALHGIHIKKSHEGRFARDVGKKPGTPITSKDIAKGKASSDPAERKRATFAANARKWNKGSKSQSTSSKLYGDKSK